MVTWRNLSKPQRRALLQLLANGGSGYLGNARGDLVQSLKDLGLTTGEGGTWSMWGRHLQLTAAALELLASRSPARRGSTTRRRSPPVPGRRQVPQIPTYGGRELEALEILHFAAAVD
jgi:hypothetical protein